MGLSVEQKASQGYQLLVQLNYLCKLTDEELDKLRFAVYVEQMDRAITRGEYKPEEE